MLLNVFTLSVINYSVSVLKLIFQEDEIEDIVGDVKYTDSQKSVTTSNVYSMDFTDSSSEKNSSSGKDTYVIEQCDSEDSETYPMHEDKSVICVKDVPKPKRDVDVQCEKSIKLNRAASTSLHNCSLAQEIFTQTSKTIFELARSEEGNKENIETQTSFISITENKTVEYRIEFKNSIRNFNDDTHVSEINSNYVLSNAVENESSRFPVSDSDTIKSDDNTSEISSDDRIINIIDEESKENVLSDENQEEQYENRRDLEESSDSDIEEDSLMEPQQRIITIDNNDSDTSEVPQSVDNDVEELYNKLSESIDLQIDRSYEPDRRFNTLTPLTEESTIKRDSLLDITPSGHNIVKSIVTEDSEHDVLFTNNAGVKVKMLPCDNDTFKLPPIQIQNRSCPNSPHLNFLFSLQTGNKMSKAGTLPCLYEDHTGRVLDRWEVGNKCLASGESALISGRNGKFSTLSALQCYRNIQNQDSLLLFKCLATNFSTNVFDSTNIATNEILVELSA